MPVTIRQLEIFKAVVESGQVTKAAEKLLLT
ncbi:MAG: LysR family transcriptional regulator, partial [Desulfobulbaceae bacterium]